MRILIVHNFYQQPGGEDQVVAAETTMLRAAGEEVVTYTRHNDELKQLGGARMALNTVWNERAADDIRRLCQEKRPDVVHFHNTFPVVSPAAYHAVASEGIPVVQTLHNYRLICPNAVQYREGSVCEECNGKRFPYPAIRHGCYRDSRAATAAVATMLWTHRLIGTYRARVDVYIALTRFGKAKFVASGIPEDRIVVKPNFLAMDPGVGTHRGGYALFVGRLTAEKGVETMVEAWRQLGGRIPLKVIGGGPLYESGRYPEVPGVEWLGLRPREEVLEAMRNAAFLVFPSIWYEGSPMTIVEAFATGLPVVASRLGAMAEVVADGANGVHFTPGDPNDLARVVAGLIRDPLRLRRLGVAARASYEEHYTPERNYELLMNVYRRAIASEAGAAGLARSRPASMPAAVAKG